MADMFGAPIGDEAAERTNLMTAQLAMLPLKAAQTQAQTKFLNARGSLAQQQAEAQRRMAEIAQTRHVDSLWGMAEAAVEAGVPDAYKYANAASLVDYRRTAGKTQELRATEIAAKTRIEMLDEKARMLQGVRSAQDLQFALREYESRSGDKSGLLDANGNLVNGVTDADIPAIVGRLRAQAMSTKDQVLMGWRERALSSADAERKSKQKSRDFWQNMDHQQEREEARARGRTAGHGETNFLPSQAQISAGADYLSLKFNTDAKAPWARVLGRELIENAKRARTLNPALSAREALDQSFQQMDKQGKFAGKHLVDKKADLNRPMQLPYGPDGKPDPSKLREGQLYMDANGQTRTWEKSGWSTTTRKIDVPEISDEDARKALGVGLSEDDTEDDDATAEALSTDEEK